jgi:uncharacterized membrane protein
MRLSCLYVGMLGSPESSKEVLRMGAVTMPCNRRVNNGLVGLMGCLLIATSVAATSHTLEVERELKRTGIAPGGPAYWTIRFGNKCSTSDVFVAVRYQDTNGRWVTEGWWEVPYQQRLKLAKSKSSQIFFYAEDGNRRQTVGTTHAYRIASARTHFKYYEDQGKRDDRVVNFLEQSIRQVNALWLTCG